MQAVVTDSSAVLQRKWVRRSIMVAASGVAVALTGVTVECKNKATTVETLVIIKGQAAINTRTMKCQGCAVFIQVPITVSEWKMKNL